MKILVTGGCGFIGSNLVDILVDRGDEVSVVDNLSSGKIENCNDKVKYIFEDVKDALKNMDFEPDVIFHLAAMPRIQPSFKDPVGTYENNTTRTMIVCDYAKKHGAKVVYSGSSTFYGGAYLNPYAFSKWLGEEVCKFYSRLYGLNTSIARFFNVYGPRHLEEGLYATVVAIFERQYRSGMPLTVTGDGEQRRDFTHVSDICNGLIAISEGNHRGEVFNLGSGKNCSIKELAEMFEGSKIKYIEKRPGEARETLADISFTEEKVGWSAKKDIRKYIKNFLEKGES